MPLQLTSDFLKSLHLDRGQLWLNARQTQLLHAIYDFFDVHRDGKWNDAIFYEFMRQSTDLTDRRIIRVFDMLDKGCRGFIVFEEFYVVICLMVAAFNKLEKKFILRHAKMCFTLMDEDFSGSISAEEFTGVGFLWNLEEKQILKIFKEYDVNGDAEIDWEEFRFFAMAALSD
ncbi:putative EF-hand calcium-binding domain-containing protein 9 [Hypsibius exemplaris]|uniref:EF-hand calcium-binding domain-containing protein 9 n=1 Tax=Hypsibius exemplaris TaxID=2072580 RepID=A0A1W0WMY5_HYPEX|nr:putative EF-hand calcium-binding domain-containing protein 9 [Hypsibius exemplaris]